MIFFLSSPAFAQEKAEEKNAPLGEAGVSSETPKALGAGKVIFFPDDPKRPADDRFAVKAGELVEVCVQINPEYSPVFKELQKIAYSFRLVLEDDKTPPSAIVINGGDKKNPIVLDPQGCYRTSFQIPPQTNEGVYQVADLLFNTRLRNYLSVHQNLFDFTQADELKVSNEKTDSDRPELIKIGSDQDEVKQIGKHFGFLKIQVTQFFTFQDDGSGIAPKTLRVFYLLKENGQGANIHEAKCKKRMGKKGVFRCRVNLLRPEYEWEMAHLSLELESIYLKDKLGNLLVLNDSKMFSEKADGTPVKFVFQGMDPGVPRKIKYKNQHPNRLRDAATVAPK